MQNDGDFMDVILLYTAYVLNWSSTFRDSLAVVVRISSRIRVVLSERHPATSDVRNQMCLQTGWA
jgi:hypothetical protein